MTDKSNKQGSHYLDEEMRSFARKLLEEERSNVFENKATFSDAMHAALLGVPAGLMGSLPFFVLVFIGWLTGVAGSTKETLGWSIGALGFFMSYGALVGFVETRWPSRTKIRVGNYGLWPQKTAILFFVWLPIYFFLAGLIAIQLGVEKWW